MYKTALNNKVEIVRLLGENSVRENVASDRKLRHHISRQMEISCSSVGTAARWRIRGRSSVKTYPCFGWCEWERMCFAAELNSRAKYLKNNHKNGQKRVQHHKYSRVLRGQRNKQVRLGTKRSSSLFFYLSKFAPEKCWTVFSRAEQC